MNNRGFTFVEVFIILAFLSVVAAITIPAGINQIEKAKLARCMADLRAVQAEVWNCTPDGLIHPQGKEFWDCAYGGIKPGPFVYLVDGDPNAGHGNDIDGVDEENPGASDPDDEDIRFVVYCKHNHRDLADYVYISDHGPPVIVSGPDDDPGWRAWEKWEFKF